MNLPSPTWAEISGSLPDANAAELRAAATDAADKTYGWRSAETLDAFRAAVAPHNHEIKQAMREAAADMDLGETDPDSAADALLWEVQGRHYDADPAKLGFSRFYQLNKDGDRVEQVKHRNTAPYPVHKYSVISHAGGQLFFRYQDGVYVMMDRKPANTYADAEPGLINMLSPADISRISEAVATLGGQLSLEEMRDQLISYTAKGVKKLGPLRATPDQGGQDLPCHKINCLNKLLFVDASGVKAVYHPRERVMLYTVKTEYVPGSKCPGFHRHTRSALEDDERAILTTNESMAATFLSGVLGHRWIVMLYGIIGKDYTCNMSPDGFDFRRGPKRAYDKAANINQEIKLASIKNPVNYLAITGGVRRVMNDSIASTESSDTVIPVAPASKRAPAAGPPPSRGRVRPCRFVRAAGVGYPLRNAMYRYDGEKTACGLQPPQMLARTDRRGAGPPGHATDRSAAEGQGAGLWTGGSPPRPPVGAGSAQHAQQPRGRQMWRPTTDRPRTGTRSRADQCPPYIPPIGHGDMKSTRISDRGTRRDRANPAKARPYEESLAREAASGNTLLILPPGPTRLVVRLAARRYMETMAKLARAKCPEAEPKPLLLLAPNLEAVNSIKAFLKGDPSLGTMAGITWRDRPIKRAKAWNGPDVVCATPEVFLADLQRQIDLSPERHEHVTVAELRERLTSYHVLYQKANRLRERRTPYHMLYQKATDLWEWGPSHKLRQIVEAPPGEQRPVVSPDQFGLVVVVEAHRAAGSRVYAEVARRLSGDTRILAVTDALSGNDRRTAEVLKTLKIVRVDGRSEYSPDVVSQREPGVEYMTVDPSPEIIRVRDDLGRALADARAALRGNGCGALENSPLIRPEWIRKATRRARVEAAEDASFLLHAMDVLEAHGAAPFLNFCGERRGRPGVDALLGEPRLAGAVEAAREALARGADHPKMAKLASILAAPGRALVVAGRDDSAQAILRHLKAAGIPSAVLPSEAGAAGLARMERTVAVEGFRTGRYRVLVAVGAADAYEGAGDDCLGPDHAGLVVCYVGDPETVRLALDSGAARVVVLAAKGSVEDPYSRTAAQLDWRAAQALEENRKEGRPDEP